jgi:AraC-like DNA-binding protein
MNVDESTYGAGYRSDWHACEHAQLIIPTSGVLTLRTNGGGWMIPPNRGCWLPPNEPHQVATTHAVRMYSVYCSGRETSSVLQASSGPQGSGIVAVSDLQRAAIDALARPGNRSAHREERIAAIVADEISFDARAPLALPNLGETVLGRIEAALLDNPADPRGLEGWAAELGVSAKTLARTFARVAHLTFRQYRSQVRLSAAVARLGAGTPVTQIAFDLGYTSASHFIAHFRSATGVTPGRYFSGAAVWLAP